MTVESPRLSGLDEILKEKKGAVSMTGHIYQQR